MLLTLFKEPFMAAGSLLTPFASPDLKKAPLRSAKSDRDATTALRETVEAIWKGVEQASSGGPSALLARRDMQR